MILPFFVLQGDSLHLRKNKIVDQSWSNSNKHTHQLMSEQPSKDFPVAGNKIRSFPWNIHVLFKISFI